MSLQPTTLRTLYEDIASAIRDTVPPEKPSYRFTPVSKISDVPGGGFRNFILRFSDFEVGADDSIHGEGVEVGTTLRVVMNYHGAEQAADETALWDDGQEIWIALSRKISTSITGLMSVLHQGWEDIDDEHGQRWGAHVYRITFFARGLLASD